jgi:polysaccharide deacetylase family protein (PEP-CTERM system associated)
VLNVLSVDVEEYFHAEIFQVGAGHHATHALESRVEASVDLLLALLARNGARGTFFTLGEIAAAHPSVVRAIAAMGHEIACHGYRHECVYRMTPAEFRADIRRAKQRLEDLTGTPVIGYRAPNFSIGPGQTWAYAILLEEGFRYDSSTHPILHDRYGRPNAPRFPYGVFRSGMAWLTEFPIGTARCLGVNLPIGGGGYFRLSPYELVRRGIRHVNTRDRQPVMFYLHPWELDPGQPRVPMARRHRFRHYAGLEQHAAKLSRLLADFRFGTAREVLEHHEPLPDPADAAAAQVRSRSSEMGSTYGCHHLY